MSVCVCVRGTKAFERKTVRTCSFHQSVDNLTPLTRFFLEVHRAFTSSRNWEFLLKICSLKVCSKPYVLRLSEFTIVALVTKMNTI